MAQPAGLALVIPSPPSLQEATKNSTLAWQEHLEALFRHAKDRFPDVVWELGDDVEDPNAVVEEVWGHKAIVYARAPPSFQSRYFSFRPHNAPSPHPYSSSPNGTPYPAESALSLGLDLPRTPSPSYNHRSTSPSNTVAATLNPATLLRLTTSINPALFANELEYLYTGKGFGEAFEFLFDSSEARDHLIGGGEDDDPEALRIDKLRKDLVFMWRSRLYSDVRIALTGNFSASQHENTTAIFSSHRFILVSRSSYFHTALLSWPSPPKTPSGNNSEPPTLTLPSPPFTPASLHFTLGFMYTGTLIFSHRSYDLSTAFAILRAAMYLGLPSLHDEVQARITQEMMHGLFHAFISFAEYDRLTGGKWGTGGCRCRQCARRAPRVLEFALEEDVKNPHLERGARRALVGLFGEGWCNTEFASLHPKIRDSVLKGLGKRTTPVNVFALLFAAEHALGKLGAVIEPWGDVSREMVVAARKGVDEVLCVESERCFGGDEWLEVMESDGVRFEDGERVEWVMAAVLRGVREPHAANLYQTLVSSILLRPHPTEVNAPMLSATSHIRVQVEQTRLELLKWIGKRWLAIRQERGFDALEGWALKEISDHIEVPIEDLLNPPPSYSSSKHPHLHPHGPSPKRNTNLLRPMSNHPHTSKVDAESDVASSMRVSVLSRSLPMRQHSTITASSRESREGSLLSSSASSVRSARSTASFASAASGSTVGLGSGARASSASVNAVGVSASGGGMSPAKMIAKEARAGRKVDIKDRERPDSKLTPDSSSMGTRSPSPRMQPSIVEPDLEEEEGGEEEYERGDARREEDGEGQSEDEDGERGREDVDDQESVSETASVQDTLPLPPPLKKTLITRASLASVTSRTSTSTGQSAAGTGVGSRPKSSAASIRSTNTLRKTSPSTLSTPRPGHAHNISSPRPLSRGSTRSAAPSHSRLTVNAKTQVRPTSRVSIASSMASSSGTRPTSSLSTSTTTDGAGTYRTASTGLSTPTTRSRRTSAASTVSVRTTTTTNSNANSPVHERERVRKVSSTSINSVVSTAPSARTPLKRAAPPVPVPGGLDAKRLGASPAVGAGGRVVSRSTSGGSASGSGTPKKVVPVVARKILLKKSGDSLASLSLSSSRMVVVDTEKVKENEQAKGLEKDVVVVQDVQMDMEVGKEKETPAVASVGDQSFTSTTSTMTIKPKPRAEVLAGTGNTEHKKTSSSASTSSVATLKRRASTDTIKTVKAPTPGPAPAPTPSGNSNQHNYKQQAPPGPPRQQPLLQRQGSSLTQPPSSIAKILGDDWVPRGATLEIGIPCIISSKRKRFKAFARYIGEVEGETGPWVGVEVPMPIGDNWAGDRFDGSDRPPADDRQWNDGSWCGVRYFEIAGAGSEWEYGGGEDRAARRRRVDNGSVGGAVWGGGRGDKGVLKREGDQLSVAGERMMKRVRSVSPAVSEMSGTESRGLFVRPQQVLYVVDAVGADL
ncbi:hypothetical protein B0H34DRAFT_798582 [Crassisporium funariophilum]|nr:hypothetical protein B0H34DRAFT_798582 [Crassisporium funariophilum]